MWVNTSKKQKKNSKNIKKKAGWTGLVQSNYLDQIQ